VILCGEKIIFFSVTTSCHPEERSEGSLCHPEERSDEGSPVINSKILRFFGTSSLRMTGGENSSGEQKRKFSPQ